MQQRVQLIGPLWQLMMPCASLKKAIRALLTWRRGGIDSGPPDGMMRPATRRGIRQYQRSLGLPADGFPSLKLLQQLQLQ